MQVADFGLARLTSDNNTHISTRVMGTFGYDQISAGLLLLLCFFLYVAISQSVLTSSMHTEMHFCLHKMHQEVGFSC